MSEAASGPGPPQPAVRRLLLWLEPELEPVTHRAGALTVGPRTVRRAPLSRGRPPGSEGRGAGRAGACGSEPGRSPPGAVPSRGPAGSEAWPVSLGDGSRSRHIATWCRQPAVHGSQASTARFQPFGSSHGGTFC